MNKSVVCILIACALFSINASAGQSNGRDSVYAAGSASFPSAKAPAVTASGNGRGSVYARELPAPTARDQVKLVTAIRSGRS